MTVDVYLNINAPGTYVFFTNISSISVHLLELLIELCATGTPFDGYYRFSVILSKSVFQSASCSVYVIDLEIDIVPHHC